MPKRGFIFSLDAFIAFTLVTVAISFLIFAISAPKSFNHSLEQAHQLAHDGLFALTESSGSDGEPSYLDQVIAGGDQKRKEILRRVLGGEAGYNSIIPKGYGFRLEKFNFANNQWETPALYDSNGDAGSDRNGREFTKLQASSSLFTQVYSTQPNIGQSPYCYYSCSGRPGVEPAGQCLTTPCDRPISDFSPGKSEIVIVRLVVYA